MKKEYDYWVVQLWRKQWDDWETLEETVCKSRNWSIKAYGSLPYLRLPDYTKAHRRGLARCKRCTIVVEPEKGMRRHE